MRRLRIKDLFRNPTLVYNCGIFKFLYDYDSNLTTPLLYRFIKSDNYASIDEDYLWNHSAEKCVSPFLERYIKFECESNGWDYYALLNGEFTDTQLTSLLNQLFDFANGDTYIMEIIENRFASKWNKIWDAINTAYNPLENYSMEEKRTPDITKETTFDTTDERTPDLTKTTNGTGSTTTDSETGIYGFNSSDSNPSGTIDGNQTDTITDRTETETGTDTSTKTGTITDTETGTDTIERSGNIGVTTSQQMLQSEIEIRQYDFFQGIYKDIDSILCLKSY